MVSRAAITTDVSARKTESLSSESVMRESAWSVSDMACSAADVSSNLLRIRESVSALSLMVLPASIPNDCIAATSTSRVGTHIFAIKRFIQDGKGTDFFSYIRKKLSVRCL